MTKMARLNRDSTTEFYSILFACLPHIAFKEILPLVIQFVITKVLSKLATRLTIYAYASNSRYIML